MSSGRAVKTTNNGGESLALSSIPASSRKTVQSLKEIVNRSEQEIYITLKECNMDLNDTVSRLLSQDPFHEVKSKREKRKEVKETSEPRPRGVSGTSVRGGRSGTTRYDGRSGSTQFSDSGVSRGKPAYKKENGPASFSTSSTFAYDAPDSYSKRQPTSFSGSVENKPQPAVTTDGTSSSSQTSSGYQSAWVGAPGQISMADIVKMGGRRKVSELPNSSTETSHRAGVSAASNHNVNYPILSAPPQASYSGLVSSQGHAPRDSVSVNEAGGLASQHAYNDWDLVEQPSARGQSVLDPSASAEVYTDTSISSNLYGDGTKLHPDSWADGVQETEQEDTVEHVTQRDIESESDRQTQAENSAGASHFDNDSFNNVNHTTQRDTSENHEGNGGSSRASMPNYSGSSAEDVNVAVSSAAANLHQLSLQEQGGVSTQVKPAVIIPSHLQIPTEECSHLSFGSFGSVAANANLHASHASNSLDESRIAVDNTPDHPEARGSSYFEDERLQSTAEWNAAPGTSADATGSYDSSTQPEVPRQEAGEAIQGHQYNFPTSAPGYTLDNSRQLNAAFLYEQANSQLHNLAPLSSVMQAYSNSLQSNTSAPAVQQARESPDLTYSSFLAAQQSAPTKYSTSGSSINGPSLSMPESAKPSMFSMPHPAAQTLPGTNISSGPALPQHLVHPYSQPTLPLGHFANMVGYPFLPQSYAYVPPGYQQAYASNSTYHQSPTTVHNTGMKYTLPQYKSSGSVSSLPQSASVASPYGGFGGSVNMPGSFQLNPSTNSSSTGMGYEDVMNAQYKESKHFLPLQQNDSSTVWVQGPGSRTVSALPASTYYSLQGQAQQHSGFRQAQQPSQHYGNLGYQNFYHSQAGVSQEHQQQTQNDGTLNGAQGQSGKQSHQMWQHSY